MIYHEVEPGCVFDFCSLLRIFLVAGCNHRIHGGTSRHSKRNQTFPLRNYTLALPESEAGKCQASWHQEAPVTGKRGKLPELCQHTHKHTHQIWWGFFFSLFLHTNAVVENVAILCKLCCHGNKTAVSEQEQDRGKLRSLFRFMLFLIFHISPLILSPTLFRNNQTQLSRSLTPVNLENVCFGVPLDDRMILETCCRKKNKLSCHAVTCIFIHFYSSLLIIDKHIWSHCSFTGALKAL